MKQQFDDDRNKWVKYVFYVAGFFLSTQVVGKAIWGAQNAGNCLGCGEGCKKE